MAARALGSALQRGVWVGVRILPSPRSLLPSRSCPSPGPAPPPAPPSPRWPAWPSAAGPSSRAAAPCRRPSLGLGPGPHPCRPHSPCPVCLPCAPPRSAPERGGNSVLRAWKPKPWREGGAFALNLVTVHPYPHLGPLPQPASKDRGPPSILENPKVTRLLHRVGPPAGVPSPTQTDSIWHQNQRVPGLSYVTLGAHDLLEPQLPHL